MKCLQLILTVLGLLLCTASVRGYFYEHFFAQKLLPIDQFETRTWQNRYYLDDSYYTPGGPMFLSTGASVTFKSDDWLNYTYFYEMGREMNALLVFTEHRFYGDSRPTPDASLSNLGFLDSRYAVDDVANLVSHLKEEYQTGAVIAHGFDHGAAVSVWLAHRHPHLVDGVWASSATILAMKDNSLFLTNVAEDIRIIGGEECYQKTEQAFERMEALYAAGNYVVLEEAFNLCSSFSPRDDSEAFAFFYTYVLTLGSVVRYSHRAGVEVMCNYLDTYENPMIGFASFIVGMLPDCVQINYHDLLDDIRDSRWESEALVMGMTQITYQYCREVGWFVSSSGENHPFGNRFPIERFQQQCENLFGPAFSAPNMMTFMDQTNRIFGGNRPNITNAYFTVGEYDPAKELGVLESYADSIHVDIIPGYGAGAEVLASYTNADSTVQAVRARARELITQWIAEAAQK